jgi:dTDP-4-amino-4,6-dideoxygalactose transaminase
MSTLKASVRDFALLGGPQAFAQRLYVGRPNVGDEERFIERVREVFQRGWLTNHGPCVQELEGRLAAELGVRHCILTCNATTALLLLFRALDLKGEVILPSFTFVATAHALRWLGIKPVFCDVDPGTHNIDPADAARRITEATSAIVGVHLWGRPCPIRELEALSRQHDLALVFDAAHAFGCSYKGESIGRFGSAEVFSLHATKSLNAFEGGAITTNDDALAEQLIRMRNFGLSPDGVECLGINAKMTEVCAAMALTNLESYPRFREQSQANYHCYQSELADLPGLRLCGCEESEQWNFHYVVVRVDESAAGISRDDLMRVLWSENVIARPYFSPGCHQVPPYKKESEATRKGLPVSEALSREVLVLPNGISIQRDEVTDVCRLIRAAFNHAHEISKWMRSQPDALVR